MPVKSKYKTVENHEYLLKPIFVNIEICITDGFKYFKAHT